MNIDDYAEQLDKQIAQYSAMRSQVSKIKERFPDVEVHKNRWNRTRIFSSAVNPIATDVEIRHSCGCCADSPLLITPVYEDEEIKVYGSVEICIGQQNELGYGDILDPDWEDRLQKLNMSDAVIKKIKKYAEEHAPEDFEDD